MSKDLFPEATKLVDVRFRNGQLVRHVVAFPPGKYFINRSEREVLEWNSVNWVFVDLVPFEFVDARPA